MHSQLSCLILVVAFLLPLVNGSQKEILLNGDDWLLSDEAGRVKNLQVNVPGIVHVDLLKNKIIDDPYYGYNDEKMLWVAFSNWTYTLKFQLSSDDVNGKNLILKCDGIDTVANISLNGITVGFANNFNRRWLFDITDTAKIGSNTLTIRIEAAANYSAQQKNRYPYQVYPSSLIDHNYNRNFIRKPPFDFGWDWGPCFMPSGIWQNISIVSFDQVFISTVAQKPFYDKLTNSYAIEVLVCMEVKKLDNQKITVSLTVPKTPFETLSKWDVAIDQIGETCYKQLTKPVKSSDMDEYLWKPYSSSSKTPLLYDAEVTVDVVDIFADLKLFSMSHIRRIGFRNIEINQDSPPDKSNGSLFSFQQSDSKGSYPIYAKGSDVISMDAFINRVTPAMVKRMLTSAIMANQNLIRLWGLYYPDWFYGICDELGIMVWHELMFSNTRYPTDQNFLLNVQEEVKYTVRRIGYHPSIVLWSGNNEIQSSIEQNSLLLSDYIILYDRTVRPIIWEEDSTRFYWPSSPSNGALVDDKELGIYMERFGNPQDTDYGDIHRYDYENLCTDVTLYPRPRFASEFGFQSFPSFASLRRVSDPSDWDSTSELMNHRQHHPNGNPEIINMINKFFNPPQNANKTVQFKDFIYLSQVVQTICITSQAEHYRRTLSETGYNRGIMYWQLNDIWQAPTWASIEYAGRWKLLHYGMRKVYAEVMVSAYQLNDHVVIYVTNDQPGTSVKYDLKISIIKWSDGSVAKTFSNSSLTSKGFTGVMVFNETISTIFPGTNIKESFMYISISETGSGLLLSDETFYPSNFTMINLQKAKVTIFDVTMDSNNDLTVKFTLSSSAVAPYVYLDSGDIEGYFSDNGMIVMPNVQYNMTFTSWDKLTVDEFKKNIEIRSIRDTY